MTSAEFIEKSCGPNEPRLGYAMFGVCNATTGVFSVVCCRCCGEYVEIRFFDCKYLSCGKSSGRHTSLYDISSFVCMPEFIGAGMTTRKFELRVF